MDICRSLRLSLLLLAPLLTLTACYADINGVFVIDLCDPQVSVLSGYQHGNLRHNSSVDTTRYKWCSCKICDTSEIDLRSEHYFNFHADKVLFYKPAQSLNYSYPHAEIWKFGSWANNTPEGVFAASLYKRCAQITLYLHSGDAQVDVRMNFKANRSEVTMTCTVKGLVQVFDDGNPFANMDPSKKSNSEGIGIGVGVAVIVCIGAVGGLCVCKKTKRNRSRELQADQSPKYTGDRANEEITPRLHRDLDVDKMQLRIPSLLHDDASKNKQQNAEFCDPGYDPVGTPETDYPGAKDGGYDNVSYDPAGDEPFYHSLDEFNSSPPANGDGSVPNSTAPMVPPRDHPRAGDVPTAQTDNPNSPQFELVPVPEAAEPDDGEPPVPPTDDDDESIPGGQLDSSEADPDQSELEAGVACQPDIADNQCVSATESHVVADEYAVIIKSPKQQTSTDL